MKLVTLSPKRFDKFALEHKYRNYNQTSTHGDIMKSIGHKIHYFGFVDDGKLVGATMVMYRTIFMNNKIAYAPRGILFDFTDPEKVHELAVCLKKQLGKQGFMLFRMDPYIPIGIYNNTGDILNINNQGNDIIKNLTRSEFKYKGKNLFFENENSRWESLIVLDKEPELLFQDFDEDIKENIEKAEEIGIDVYKSTHNGLRPLYNFLRKGEKRNIKYYKSICDCYQENANIYYARINTKKFIINSKKIYEQELQINEELNTKLQESNFNNPDRNDLLNKKMKSDKLVNVYKNYMLFATELLKKHPKGIIIGGALTVIFDNAAYLIAESYSKEFSELEVNNIIKWQMIKDYENLKIKYINLNAIVGDLKNKTPYSKLNKTKLGFNSVITEYIGEFDLVLNNFVYNLYKSLNKDK